jgi:uncharacterized protein (DUF488 family)
METVGGMRLSNKFFTIGHGTRSIDDFIELLNAPGVRLVVDVRTAPHSRANPQFDGKALAVSLARFGIEYRHVAELGGLRPRQKQIPESTNAFWQNQSFHNYADYAMGREFESGLVKLRQLGHAKQCAIMCAETLWWRCHRRIIGDYLLAAGETVCHILNLRNFAEASLTPAAKRRPDGVLIYPA